MNQGPRRISLMEKKEGQKSRGTIPLNRSYQNPGNVERNQKNIAHTQGHIFFKVSKLKNFSKIRKGGLFIK